MTPWGMIPQGVSFFDTKVRITRRNLNQNRKYLNTLSVAQAGLNDEKNWQSKIRLDCHFKDKVFKMLNKLKRSAFLLTKCDGQILGGN